jgi:hypothetical protein
LLNGGWAGHFCEYFSKKWDNLPSSSVKEKVKETTAVTALTEARLLTKHQNGFYPPFEQKIAPAFSGYRPSVAVCRRALASLRDQARRDETGTIEPKIFVMATYRRTEVAFAGSWAPGQSQFAMGTLRLAHPTSGYQSLELNQNHQDIRTAHTPPYEAGEHWRNCAIRPARSIQGLYRRRLAPGCADSSP